MKLPGRSFRFSVLNIKFFIFIAFFLLSFLTLNFKLLTQVYAATGANQQVNFQGKVVNANGTNVTDGVLDFVIKIYDGPGSSATTLFTESWTSAALWSSTMSTAPASGGTSLVYVTDTNESTIKVGQIITNTTKGESVYVAAINTTTNTITISPTRQAWATTDTVTNKIYVNDGIFRVIINSLNQDLSGVNFGSDSLYVGITVGSDSEMKPRVRFTATPYAMSAERLNGSYSSGTDGTNANSFTMTNSASSGSITTNALSLSLVGTNNATGTNVVNGLKFENVTAKTNNLWYGLNFGTGFTDILRYNGTQIISGSGVLQSAGLSGTYSNALTLSSTSNSITAGTLTINGDAFTDLTGTNLQISGGVLGTIANPTFSTSVTSPVIIGGTAVSSTLTLRSTSGVGTTDAIIFQVGNNGATEAVRITNGGNVGIGTTLPAFKLQVAGDIGPTTDNTYDIGSSSLRWRHLWLQQSSNIYFNNTSNFISSVSGAFSIQGGAASTGQALMSIANGNASNVFTLSSFGQISQTVTSSSNTNNHHIAHNIAQTIDTSSAGLSLYGSKLAITNNQTTNANTVYGKHISFTDAGALANTVYGLYVDVTTANTADTTYTAIFQGGSVGIGTTAPGTTLDVVGTGRFSSTLTANTFSSSGVTITGGSINGTTIGASTPSTGAFTTLSSTGATTIGNNSATVAIDSSDWDITTTGSLTGIGDLTMDGNFSQTGATTFSTGTGAISLNGDTTVAAGKNLVLASGAGTYTQTFTGTTTDAMTVTANSLTTGKALTITSSSTAGGASGASYLLNLSRSGANANAAHTAYGLYSTVTNTNATSGTNIAGYFSASGATTANWGVYSAAGTNYFSGNVGIGTTSPNTLLELRNATATTQELMRLNSPTSAGNYSYLTVASSNNPTGDRAVLGFLNQSGSGDAGAFLSAGSGANPNSGVFINASGNVGIGTTAPGAYRFNINGNTNMTGTLTASGAVAANGGITFDASTDTVGAHTAAGTYDMNSNLITNIGNSGTDFVTGGGLTLAGTFTANGAFNIGDGGDAGTISATTLDIDATGALQINSSGGAISIGNDAVAQAINIGTGAAARTITIGNNTGATGLVLTTGTAGISATTTTVSGTGFGLTANSLTTGTALQLTSTSITSGSFFDINNGSSIFNVSNTSFSTSLPTSFTAAGDVSVAYDLNFTNPTASYITSAAPLYIRSGESFNSSDLTLSTYNSGNINLDYGSSGALLITDNGTERVRIDASGNVGIGTTNPAAALDVTGTGRFSSTLTASSGFTMTTGALSLTATSGSINATGLSSTTFSVTSGTLALTTVTSGNINLTTGATTGLANILTGNLKVGNGTPSISQDGEDAYVEGIFEVDGLSTFGGNVGIGTTAPQATVHSLLSATDSWAGIFENSLGSTAPRGVLILTGQNGGNAPKLAVGTGTPASYTTNFIVTNAGSVGIGTTDPAQALEVKVTTAGPVARFTDTDGNCEINPTNTALSCTSDARLKKDVNTLSSALDKVTALRGVSFKWNSQTTDINRIGFIAQEVESVIPELVMTDHKGMKSVNYVNFAPFLVEAVKQQQEQINDLKTLFKTDEQGYLVMPKIKAEKIIVNDELRIMNNGVTLNAGKSTGLSSEGSIVSASTSGTSPEILQNDNFINVAAKLASLDSRLQTLDSTSSAKLAVLGENVASQSAVIASANEAISVNSAKIDELKRQVEDLLVSSASGVESSSSAVFEDGLIASSSAILISDLEQKALEIDSLLKELRAFSESTTSAKLTAKSAHFTDSVFVESVLSVADALTTSRLIVVDIAEFLGKVIFKDEVEFAGRATFNNDTAGAAVIKRGAKEVEIKFEKAYQDRPLVNASIVLDDLRSLRENVEATTSAATDLERQVIEEQIAVKQAALEDAVLNGDLKFIITKQTQYGFTIKLNSEATQDIKFNWSAIAVKDAREVSSN